MRHTLTDIDPEGRTAVCGVCGPTRIRSKLQPTGQRHWRCNRKKRNRGDDRAYRGLIADDSVCERCGFVPQHPSQLDVHRHRDPDPEILCANCHRLETIRERAL